MLNIWIGRNKVLRNFSMGDISELDQNSDFDCSLTGTGNHSIDVLLGKNGSGKSFVGKTLVYLAYVYYHSALYICRPEMQHQMVMEKFTIWMLIKLYAH